MARGCTFRWHRLDDRLVNDVVRECILEEPASACFAHDTPNLGVCGGSVMGTSGARNPTETVQALAWRTAQHLVKSWKSIAG